MQELLRMMWIKPQDHTFQWSEPAEYSKFTTHFGKPLAYGFVILFLYSWINETRTGSRKGQQLWQTEAIFQHKKT